MERERLTEELLHELLDAPTVDSFLGSHELPDISLSDYLQQLLEEKHLERVRVVRMADLNETFGYQIFTGERHPSSGTADRLRYGFERARDQSGADGCGRGAPGTFSVDAIRSFSFVSIELARCKRLAEELNRLGEDTIC